MEEKLLFLTPKEIIDNLKRIEQSLKRNGFTFYEPTKVMNISPLNNELLRSETKCMLDFVGLKNYNADVKFGKTNDGIAGYIESLNNTIEKTAHITVSDKYRNEWKCSIAVLAHEICHKLLAVNGLYDKDVKRNETLVDLATIYVGFGNLILNGYASDSNNQIMGYLKFDNYKVALHIMSVVYGKRTLMSTGLTDVDFIVDKALEYWENANSEYSLLKDVFVESEYQIAVLHRNLMLLSQITHRCKNDIIHEFAKYDNLFFKVLDERNGEFCNKLAAFSLLYDMVVSDNFPHHKENEFLKIVNDSLSSFIYDMLAQYQSKYRIELSYDFECPHCGTHIKNNGKVVDRNTILRCSHCGCHYYYIGEKINFSKRQRELKEKRERENAIIEERVSKIKYELNKNAEARIESAKRNADSMVKMSNQLTIKTRKEAEARIAKIRLEEQDEYKRKVKERIPFYLRWIMEKYL